MGSAVCHTERRGSGGFDPVGDASQHGRGNGHLLGEGTEHTRSGHSIADREIRYLATDVVDHAGELAARNERRREADLIVVGDQQHVGKVDGRSLDPYPDLSRLDDRWGTILDRDYFWRPVGRTDRCTHAAQPA